MKTLSLVLLLVVSNFLYSQNCINNVLSTKTLDNISSNLDQYIWKGEDNGNMLDVTISKGSSGPNLERIAFYSGGIGGVWIGKNNNVKDSTEITFSFSKSIKSLSFILAAINNDASGIETINNIRLFDSSGTDVSNNVLFNWLNDNKSGIKDAKSEATIFNKSKHSISARRGFCCNEASGRISFKSEVPFNSVKFVYNEITYPPFAPNGVILSGDMIFCVSGTIQEINKAFENVIGNVLFQNGESKLLENSFEEIEKLVDLLKMNKQLNVELQGYTDNVGDDKRNLILSQNRVDVVKAYLIKLGIEINRINAKGFGEENPIVPNDTEEHRSKNRRVNLIIY